jgi:hypothetical protein
VDGADVDLVFVATRVRSSCAGKLIAASGRIPIPANGADAGGRLLPTLLNARNAPNAQSAKANFRLTI